MVSAATAKAAHSNTIRIEMELLARLGHFFEQVRADADFATFANELRRHQVSYYIYFVSTGNMNFVMANDEVISIKSARGLLRVRSAPASADLGRGHPPFCRRHQL
jgi:uncharacterized protein YbcV (DUF1398 family)